MYKVRFFVILQGALLLATTCLVVAKVDLSTETSNSCCSDDEDDVSGTDDNSWFDWRAMLLAMACAVAVDALLVAMFLCVRRSLTYWHMRLERRLQDIMPVAALSGDVKIELADLKPLPETEEAVMITAGEESQRSQKPSVRNQLTINSATPVVGLRLAEFLLIIPFHVIKGSEHAVEQVVAGLRSLQLRNVCRVLGYVFQSSPRVFGLVMEYGEHGTLFDLLDLDDLDITLKLPLLADLSRGLNSIHKSSIKYHGNLTSAHCIIDTRFMLKVRLQEFQPLKRFGKLERTIDQIGTSDRELLWTAPEILRQERNPNMQMADMYSFAIIAHEVFVQRGPFYVNLDCLNTVYRNTDGPYPHLWEQDEMAHFIVTVLRDKSSSDRLLRPSFPTPSNEDPVMIILREMVCKCWETMPKQRWKMSRVRDVIHTAMRDLKITSVLTAMQERLRFFTNHLNAAVETKCKQVQQGRIRTMNILDTLYPGGMAELLLNGQTPPAVEYHNICAYLNDLVGFTKICSMNKPDTVVKFLNDLICAYDDIVIIYDTYPVTRIGDAYLLVSGVPMEKDSKYHASEIGQAALQIVETVKSMKFPYIKGDSTLKIRTGIACGRAVAGIIGRDVPAYAILGDAFEIACVMESNSAPFEILVNQSAYDLMKDEFEFKLEPPKEVSFYGETITCHWLKSFRNSCSPPSISRSAVVKGKKSSKQQGSVVETVGYRLDGKAPYKVPKSISLSQSVFTLT